MYVPRWWPDRMKRQPLHNAAKLQDRARTHRYEEHYSRRQTAQQLEESRREEIGFNARVKK